MKRASLVALVAAVALAIGFYAGTRWARRGILPPIVEVRIAEADLAFDARLDSGAVVSSINAHEIEVVGGGPRPSRDDVGKPVSFVLVNAAGERRRVTAPIEQVRGVRMADCREVRYHVYLTVRFRDRPYRVLTNLNDRSGAGERLLLGRNWLRYGFAVAPLRQSEL